ncbi:MAG: Nif3-like dinuclear metal center hexameric protein [Christensenellales bacterium]|jgi:dinuclear metal center YbgI/SA1388 family protein
MYISKKHFLEAMESIAPGHLAQEWDNVGMLIDCGQEQFKKILFALDLTEDVAAQAIKAGADLVVTHHPIMLSGIKRLDGKTGESRAILLMVKNGISHFAVHTNFDCAECGTNAHLANILGLKNPQPLLEDGMGRVGDLEREMTLSELSKKIGEALNAKTIRAAGDPERTIRRLAIVTGSGMSLIREAEAAGADALLTGDAKYHAAAEAVDFGVAVIDAGHFATERPGMIQLIQGLQAHFNALQCKTDIMTELCLAEENDVFWTAGNPVE